VVFERLHLWIDPLERPGPEAMAVDEWLLENATLPVLRVYRWRGEWGSVGYFGKLAEARHSFPGISWVRRWTVPLHQREAAGNERLARSRMSRGEPWPVSAGDRRGGVAVEDDDLVLRSCGR
jgi:hypothetical protein